MAMRLIVDILETLVDRQRRGRLWLQARLAALGRPCRLCRPWGLEGCG